uniref:Uncharacterized protein n=1 Tax=Cryptomonas curvata TaxID=233186 RepID=A0A7S0QMQ2_9CRYP
MEALAERNRVLKEKLKQAVTVANACHRALESEQKEGDEDVRRLQYALMIERAAHHQLKDNPRGHPKMPTAAEVQARMAAEEAEKAKEERRRQAQIERDARRQLAEQIEREKEMKRREKEARERKARNAEHWLSPAVQAGAKAIAVLKGRELPIFADFCEFNRSGPPRPDGHPRTEAIASGAPSIAPPDRPRPAPLRLRPLPDRFVQDHPNHLRGVSGFRPLTY